MHPVHHHLVSERGPDAAYCGAVQPLVLPATMHGTEDGREAQLDGGPLVEELREQILYLRSQLDVRAEEIQRRDVIISQLTQATSNLLVRITQMGDLCCCMGGAFG